MIEDYNLERFLNAQEILFPISAKDIKKAKKENHWMWYIFPQIQGLGYNSVTKYYELRGLEEVRAYLQHLTLGPRLLKLCQELYAMDTKLREEIFSRPDDKKLHASITLFYSLPGSDPIFQKVLEKYFRGKKERRTQRILEKYQLKEETELGFPDSAPVFIV